MRAYSTMKLFILLVIVVGGMGCVFGAMTESQMKAAFKLIRNVCQPKNKATDAQIEAMHKGNWNQNKNGMCYMNCVLNYYKLQLPDNSFDWETGLKVVEAQAPPSIAVVAIEAINNCKESVKTLEDKCMAALEISKCLYDTNPEHIGSVGCDWSKKQPLACCTQQSQTMNSAVIYANSTPLWRSQYSVLYFPQMYVEKYFLP